MIPVRIDNVEPTAREMRALNRGWGAIHWVCILPSHAFLLGLLAYGFLARDAAPAGLFSAVLVVSWLVLLGGQAISRRASEAAARKAPTGGLTWTWIIDDQFLTFDNGLQVNRVDWRAVKSVNEDRDRFVFLVTPGYNPVLPKRLLDPGQRVDVEALISEAGRTGRLGAGVD